jgi:hypothetical protein
MDRKSISRRRFLARAGISLLRADTLSAAVQVQRSENAGVASSGRDRVRVFRESREIFPNPERGFYTPRMTNRMNRLDDLRQQGISLVLVEMDLRDFKERDLTPAKLEELQQSFAAARHNGLKALFRAAYGFTSRDYRADPRDMDRILGHIRQLGTVFTQSRDVLCGVQAGFLGPWGEWHGSNWGDPPSLEARRRVLFALLDAVPAPITVQVRRPMFIRDIFADEPSGYHLTDKTAYRGSRLSRTGWHNDAFLALPNDMGTYVEPGWDRQRELQWCSRHGRFTPFGGETVGRAVDTPVDQAVREMELLHATYLNIAYHPQVLRRWRETEYRGENAFQHIARRLGYRFVAERLRCPAAVKAGETFRFELALKNVGFASPHLPREVAVAWWHNSDEKPALRVVLKSADPRRWGPEAGTIRLQGRIPVPARLPRGNWRLALQLADPADRLRNDGRYAIRLANDDIPFSEHNGWNILAEDIAIR